MTRGTLHVHVTRTHEGVLGDTKTGATRRIQLEPAVRPLLGAMMDRARLRAADGGHALLVEDMPRRTYLAAALRKHLAIAGITRAELFADDDTRRPISFHDLRATGVTWRAVRGDSPIAIQHDAGHSTFATTQGYVRLAGTLGAVGAVFPELPATFVTGFVTDRDACHKRTGETVTLGEKERGRIPVGCHEQSLTARNCIEPAEPCEQFETRTGRFVTGFVTEIGTLERWALSDLEAVQ